MVDNKTSVTSDAMLHNGKRKKNNWRWLWLVPAIALLVAIGLALWIDTASGHRYIENWINEAKTESGLEFQIDGINGSIYNDLTIQSLHLKDPKGKFFAAQNIAMQWFPLGFIGGRLSIDTLDIKTGELSRLPALIKTNDDGPKLPDFDIFIGSLNAPSIYVDPKIMGRADSLSMTGNADIQSGRARLEFLLSSVSGNDIAYLDVDIEPDDDMFKIAADIDAPENGFIQTLSGIKWADKIIVSGRGSYSQWDGRLNASRDEEERIDLILSASDGDYSARGDIASVALPAKLLRNISVPVLTVDLAGGYDNRMVRFKGAANSQNVILDVDGGYDFALGGPDALLIDFDILKETSVARNLTGKSISGRARLDGPLSNMKIEYVIDADTIGLGAVQLEGVNAKGEGRRVGKAITFPLIATARNALGLDPQILELTNDIRATGDVLLNQNRIIIDNMAVKSNRIAGNLDVNANLAAREYDIVFDGKLPSYLVQGIGLADIQGQLNFNPAQPIGVAITGDVRAEITRMDNGFGRELTGGLPVVNAKIALGPDQIFRFPSFKITSPLLGFSGSGRRLADRSYLIEGQGVHQQYGSAKAVISGDISRPKITLNLDRPLNSLGLRDVAITLTPFAIGSSQNGFKFTGNGQSLLGPFLGNGDLLLPVDDNAVVQFDRLLVSETVAVGRIRNSDAGLIGDFTVNQGGVDGNISVRPDNGAQRLNADFKINNARFRGDDNILIRSGKFNIRGLFDAGSSDVDATLQAQGISRGDLILGRIAGNAKIKNGTGEVTASIAGTRGSGFDITANMDVSPNRYTLRANGNYRRKPIKLTRDAVITNDGGIWRLRPTRLTYGRGQLTASGRYGANIFELDALLKQLPLELLDLGDSNLGFGGFASGNIQYSSNGNVPIGNAKLNLKGLSRSGLLLSSQPIDAALNMKLQNNALAARGILSRDDDKVGRFQTKINLASGSDIMQRIRRGSLFAQGRFDGRADTLWRLTGIELFDLTGDAKISADVSGSINNPQIKGALQTQNARLESSVSGTIISNLQTVGRFDGSRLRITTMNGKTPNGGSISGNGYFDFTNSNAIGINLNIDAKDAWLIDRDDVAARVTGPIKIMSNGTGGTISGNVIMNEGRYQLGRANAAEILPNINVREINTRDDLPFTNRNITPWRLNINVTSNNRFDINGLGIASEWSGDFKIGGRIDSPTVGGRADLVRGDYDFAGRVFRLTRGSVIFNRRSPPNPQIDIVAEALLNGVDARIEVRGRSLSPEITFASTPPLPQEELLARLLFGSSVLELSAAEAIQLSSAIAGLQSGGGLDPINAIRKAVGLDRLRIVSANAATGQGTGIAVGKYIGRRTFVELVTDGRGYSATQAEFQVTRWLSILSTISTIGEQGVNVKVSRDY